ncbi:polyprenyl synthetase family protein [Cellulomonas sp. HZM]|uniref:polyprenyl synthetase family protein n=1 Tax=Cellulomonas sp. HZM TaxID=1454010 RepID=UPI00068F1EC0|nr:polyprenyl synthetase family protein [Cellulomonas sp. HZM]
MDDFLARGAAGTTHLGPENQALWTAMATTSGGGRRLRPRLLQETYRVLGGDDESAARHVGDALELLHAAFVVHDDVIDHDLRRRGRDNVAGEFVARATRAGAGPVAAAGYGQAAAVLAGDLELVGAVLAVADAPVSPAVRTRLLALLDDAVRVSAAGELQDVHLGLGTRVPSVAETIAVAEAKTAAYSFCLPLQAAGVMAGADDDTLGLLGELGRVLGIAFQLCDDLAGVFGDEVVTGKSALSDLREGKMTALVAHAASTPQWPTIEQHLGDPDLSCEDADVLRAALEACGARAFVEDLVDGHLDAARALAQEAGLDDVVDRVSGWGRRSPGRAA